MNAYIIETNFLRYGQETNARFVLFLKFAGKTGFDMKITSGNSEHCGRDGQEL